MNNTVMNRTMTILWLNFTLQLLAGSITDIPSNPSRISSSISMAEKKFEINVSAKITKCSADQIWPLLEDFFSISKWLPIIDTCYGVEGKSGEVGCIRYCATTTSAASAIVASGAEAVVTRWAKEKLVALDPVSRRLSYEIGENNFGFSSYYASMEVLPLPSEDKGGGGGDDDEEGGCEFVWSVFIGFAEEELKLENLVSFYNSSAQGMGERMQEAVLAAKQH